MNETRFVTSGGLRDFLVFLKEQLGLEVLAPTEKPATAKPSIVFEPWQKGREFTLAKATVPPKEVVLPECETLFEFKKGHDPDADSGIGLNLQAETSAGSIVVFGGRPCDARGFAELDKPYLHGLFKDPYYAAKREKLIVITQTCATGCETCFCHWVGGGPSSPIGSDVLMTEIEGGYVLQSVSEKGADLLKRTNLEDGQGKIPEMMEARKKTWASLVPAPKLADAPERLKAIFSDEKFWTYWTNRCISCGACTYFCPTCYCFNITDEGVPASPKGGRRLRSWDNCMSSRYTREASGHNSRPLKYQRMRNRVSHKFWTFFENWGSFLCSGCGRCITNCPVHLDIREIVLAAIDGARTSSPAAGE